MKRLTIILVAAGLMALVAGCTTPYGNQQKTTPPDSEPSSQPTSETGSEPATATPDDDEIHDRVHDTLYRNMGDDAGDISIRVENGEVYLSGCVDSQAQHDRAHDLAHEVSGVRAVYHDDLGVC